MEALMSFLVVGGSGNVGGAITMALARQVSRVTAMLREGRNHPKAKQLLDAGVQVVEGDLRRPETLDNAVSGINTVICSATSMPSGADDGIKKTDHDGTLALIGASEAKGVKRFVYVSYSGNIQEESPLQSAKRDCEKRLLDSKIEAVILRPSYFMESWLSPMLGFDPANGSVRVYGSGESKVSYISSSNVADFAVAAATVEPQPKSTILELGGPQALSLIEVVQLFEQQLARQLKIERVPIEALMAQHQSPDPLQKTFAALMLGYAKGDEVEDAALNAQRYRIQLRTISEYASRFQLPTTVS
jgi:NADH dehydrogenase